MEIILLGVVMLHVLGYAIATIHVVKQYLTEYLANVYSFLTTESSFEENLRHYQALFIFCIIFMLGMLTNISSHTFIYPKQIEVTDSVYRSRQMPGNWPQLSWPWIKRAQNLVDTTYMSYLKNLNEWRNKNSTAAKSGTDDLLKFVRVSRGAVLFAFLVFWIALVKIILSFLTFLLLGWNRQYGSWWYRNFIDYADKLKRQLSGSSERMICLKHVLFPNLIILFIAFFAFNLGLNLYFDATRDYHTTIFLGNQYMPPPSR